jgi:hypothetical protein
VSSVDQHLTCAFDHDCIEPWRTGSIYCTQHHREVAHEYLTYDPELKILMNSPIYFRLWMDDIGEGRCVSYPGLRRRSGWFSQSGYMALSPADGSQKAITVPSISYVHRKQTDTYRQLRFLHFAAIFLDPWFIDSEYRHMPMETNIGNIPWQLSVRDAITGDNIITDLVDDRTTVATLASTIGKNRHCPDIANVTELYRRRYLSNHTRHYSVGLRNLPLPTSPI